MEKQNHIILSEKTDLSSFTQLFMRHRDGFILFANSYVRDAAVAEDIYMEAMMSFWEKRAELSEGTNIPAYILTSVKKNIELSSAYCCGINN